MNIATLIDAIERGGRAVSQADLDVFVKAADDLGHETLDADQVTRLVLALDAGDDHDEVRWTVLHAIEHQPFEAYVVGLVRALLKDTSSRWGRLMMGRLANNQTLWPRMRTVMDVHDSGLRVPLVAALRQIAAETGKVGFERLADALV
jgi:hypothetical protein